MTHTEVCDKSFYSTDTSLQDVSKHALMPNWSKTVDTFIAVNQGPLSTGPGSLV